jgi:hypothetical protein
MRGFKCGMIGRLPDGRNSCAGGFAATDPGRRASFVQSPIPGRPATLLVLTTVVQIFENFRYHRTFIGGSHHVALEFAANIGKWQLKDIDLIKFNDDGEMIEFEVMIRPIKALAALGEEMGNRIGPQLSRRKELAGAPR